MMRLTGRTLLLTTFGLLFQTQAFALPLLQLYIDGGTYDSTTQTWITTANSFDLWVIGNVSGAGGKGTITGLDDADTSTAAGVTLVATVVGGTASMTFTGTTASVAAVNDVDIPVGPILGARSGMGGHPDLAAHGIFTGANTWQEYDLGDFTNTNALIWDAQTGGPESATLSGGGQINVYSVSVTGDYDLVHFDGFGYYRDGHKYTFAPFSHDADANDAQTVTEPVSLLLLFSGLSGLVSVAAVGRRKAA